MCVIFCIGLRGARSEAGGISIFVQTHSRYQGFADVTGCTGETEPQRFQRSTRNETPRLRNSETKKMWPTCGQSKPVAFCYCNA